LRGEKPIARDLIETIVPAPHGFMVGVELKRGHNASANPFGPEGAQRRTLWRAEDSLTELAQLAATAGVEIVGQTLQRLERIHPATYIGSGKVKELAELRERLGFDLLLFDVELSPRQQRELEEALKGSGVAAERFQVVDRTALILDIFAQHARTHEGRLQVELAQYEYRLPRLTRQWTHLARQAGGAAGRGGTGGVGLRGPGEMQLEIDRRMIRRRIAHLKDELERVRAHRRLYREQRHASAIPVVAIVGYTNAGKSTLLNALSDANVLVEDKLFATLDPTTRRVRLPSGRDALFTDTVGFIQKLPTQLVAAFRATLEEINEADLLLQVLDITHPNAREQVQTVGEVLSELGATDQPMLVALNKIDRLDDPEAAQRIAAGYANSVAISALAGLGLGHLLERIEDILGQNLVPITVQLPYQAGDLAALFRQQGIIEDERFVQNGTLLAGRIPPRLLPRFEPYRKRDS
jgi:GTP-binding protein HflX